MQKNKLLVKIKMLQKKTTGEVSATIYEGRFIGYVDDIILRLLTTKAEAIRRINSMETANLENFVDGGKPLKDKRLLFSLKSKNEKAIFDTLFITETINSVTQVSHTHTSVTKVKKDAAGFDVHENVIEKVKITCKGKKDTEFTLTEFYTF